MRSVALVSHSQSAIDDGPKLEAKVSSTRPRDQSSRQTVRCAPRGVQSLVPTPAEQSTTRKLGTESPVPRSPACEGRGLFQCCRARPGLDDAGAHGAMHERGRDPEASSIFNLRQLAALHMQHCIPINLSCHCSCRCPRLSTVTLSLCCSPTLVRNGACWLACAVRVPGSSHGESCAAASSQASLPRRALHFVA